MIRSRWLGLMLATLAACSFDGSDGEGSVAFTTWGESYIEAEIPSSVVEDGWTIRYSKFLVVMTGVSVGEASKAPAARLTTPKVFDMHSPGDKPVVTFTGLAGRPYPSVSYAIGPATSVVEIGEGATEADRALMISNGYSLYVDATATKGAVTKAFKWGFKTNTLYARCKGELSGKETDGVVVTNGGTDTVQLTIHGDHLYYDDLQSPSAKIRFDNIANADANGDGEITLEELAAVDLADRTKIPVGPYGTGNAAHINDLRAFVEELSQTLGHFRGEGECVARAPSQE